MAMIQPYIEDTSKHVYHKTSVDFTLRACSREISIVQYDKDLPIIKVELYSEKESYVLPLDCSISVRYGKVDGTSIYKYVLGCNPERTAIYFEVDEQMSSIPGFASAVIEMMIDGERVQSSPIQFYILKNPVQNNSIESHDSYPIIYQLEASVLEHDVELADHEARITALEEGDIPLDDYYTKAETDALLLLKQNLSERKTIINNQSTNNEYPTSLAVKTYVDNYGGKIDSISIGGVPQTIQNKNVDLPSYYTKLQSDDRYQPKDADLTAIAGLTGTSGLLKKTSSNTWSLDTNDYVISSELAEVAFTGDYNDLINLPTPPVIDYPVTDVTVNGASVVANKVAVITAVTQIGNRTGNITINNLKSDLGLGSLAYKSNLLVTDIPDLPTSKITSGTFADAFIASASVWNAKYTKPSTGIPDADIASASTWNAKQDALTFDSTPIENSMNPVTSGGVYSAIVSAIAGVYKPQGNETVANLNAMTKTQGMSGYVYNMSSAGTLNNYDGSTESVMIGDNVVLIWNDGDWYWDKLGGMVDLSNYVTTNTTQNIESLKTFVAQYVEFRRSVDTAANSKWRIYPYGVNGVDIKRSDGDLGIKISHNILRPLSNGQMSLGAESYTFRDGWINNIHSASINTNTVNATWVGNIVSNGDNSISFATADDESGIILNSDSSDIRLYTGSSHTAYLNDIEIGTVIEIDDISSLN